jgi:proteic killer suppression protein
VFGRQRVKRFEGIERVAYRKLVALDLAEFLDELRIPPGNRLEALSGDRKGQWSIRINQQYRLCFEWRDCDAFNVEIVDYHR